MQTTTVNVCSNLSILYPVAVGWEIGTTVIIWFLSQSGSVSDYKYSQYVGQKHQFTLEQLSGINIL